MFGKTALGGQNQYNPELYYRYLSDASKSVFSHADAEKAGNSVCSPLQLRFANGKRISSCHLEKKSLNQKEAAISGKVDPYSKSAVLHSQNPSDWTPVASDKESLTDSVFEPLQNVSRFKALELMNMSLGHRKFSQETREELLTKLTPEWSSSGFATGNRFALLDSEN